MIYQDSSFPQIQVVGKNAEKQIDPYQWESFCVNFGAGLHFLIKRSGINDTEECFNAVAKASIEKMVSGSLAIKDMPAVIRAEYRRILPQFAVAGSETVHPAEVNSDQIKIIANGLQIFSVSQQEALKRFYIDGEDAASICNDLGLSIERFTFLRTVVRQSVGRVLNDLPGVARKRPTLSHTTWATAHARADSA